MKLLFRPNTAPRRMRAAIQSSDRTVIVAKLRKTASTISAIRAPTSSTSRERDVLRLLAQGLSNAEIGEQLFIGETTVKTHVTRILQKLDVRDRAQAIVFAYRAGIVDES